MNKLVYAIIWSRKEKGFRNLLGKIKYKIKEDIIILTLELRNTAKYRLMMSSKSARTKM